MKPKRELLAQLFPRTVGASLNPEEQAAIKAKQIIRQAVNDVNMLDAIKERACIRWEQGYSDSLYMAVLSNFTDTKETIEYLAKP